MFVDLGFYSHLVRVRTERGGCLIDGGEAGADAAAEAMHRMVPPLITRSFCASLLSDTGGRGSTGTQTPPGLGLFPPATGERIVCNYARPFLRSRYDMVGMEKVKLKAHKLVNG